MARQRAPVIFDCDGVLIDSERVASHIDARELAALGFPVDQALLVERFTGVAYRDMYRMLEAEHGIALPEGYAAHTHALVVEACLAEGQALALPGIHALVERLGARPKAVASSSGHDWLEPILRHVALWERFAPHVYSAAEVPRGKPAPDVFLFAAARLGVAPADCIVIEDSVAGVQAAKAAGMTAWGFCGGGHCVPLHGEHLRATGAEAVFATMAELGAALG